VSSSTKDSIVADRRILGRLMTAITTVNIFTSQKNMAQFINQAFLDVPGVSSCSMCVRGLNAPVGDLDTNVCAGCSFLSNETGASVHTICHFTGKKNKRVLCTETADRRYGYIVLDIGKVDNYSLYEPFALNVSNTLAITIENRFHKENLETTVRERTFELLETNVELKKEISERKKAEQALKNALSEVERLKDKLEVENIYLQEEIKVEHNFEEIVSGSDVLRKVLRDVEQVASTEATVLILGETGTGKELIARAIHNLSKRWERPLVKINCSALPANLIESELFGHEKGAFTGALTQKTGRFELANNGTILLDEIGDLPLELQSKLLRILQEGEFERVGNPRTRKVDVRILAATNHNLEEDTAQGEFRGDLYYRLNVFPIIVPPLRDRKEDIPLLTRYFVKKYSAKIGKSIDSIPQSVINDLQSYHWPGNVRELENILERAVIVSRGNRLELGDWFLKTAETLGAAGHVDTLEEIERKHIIEILELTGWRVSGEKGAAKILGMKPTTLNSKMKRLNIKRKK